MSLTSFSGVVAVAQSAAHLSVLTVVEQEQVQAFFTASVSSLFPFSLPSSFGAHTCVIPLGFKTLIYPGFIGEILLLLLLLLSCD